MPVAAVVRRPANALNIEVGAPSPRCRLKTPEEWGAADPRAARWLLSGGSPYVLGVCTPQACPLKGPFDMIPELRQRIAEALKWTVEETKQFSVPTLREFLRVTHPKLAAELSAIIQRGDHLLGDDL